MTVTVRNNEFSVSNQCFLELSDIDNEKNEQKKNFNNNFILLIFINFMLILM